MTTKPLTKETPPAERSRTSLELLYAISRELTSKLDLRELLQRVLQLTMEVVGAASGSILVLDENQKVTEGALAYGGKVHDHSAEQLAYTFERGLAGWVVSNRSAVLVGNTSQDPRWLRRPSKPDRDSESRSAISAPLVARERVVGVLTLVHPEVDHYSKDDLTLLKVIADQASFAVENARLFTAEQERRRFALTLQEIARTISSTLEPPLVFSEVLSQLERVVGYDSASIFLLEDDHLHLVAARGFEDNEAVVGLTLPVESTMLGSTILNTGTPLLVEDVQNEPGWVKDHELPGSAEIHGWIGAPMIVRDRVVGVLNVDSHKIGAYGPAEVDVVSSFADHAATAVANAQLFADSQRKLEAMVSLAESSRVVTASLDLDEVLQRILSQTMHTLDVEAASLALIDVEADCLEFKVASGEGASEVIGYRLPIGKGIAGWVAETGEHAVVPNVQDDPRFHTGVDELTGFETRVLACVPIRVQEETIGVLEAINPKSGEFTPELVELLLGIAGLAGTAIAHAQLFADTKAARQRYAGLFDSSFNPILITDPSGHITDANQRAVTFLGYDHNQLIGKGAFSLHVPEDAETASDLARLKPGQALSYIGRATHREGYPLPIEVHVKRIDIGRQPYLQWIFSDISERLELDELREDLTSMIFHDLRSPLGNVISSLEVLKASLSGDDETVQSVLAIALRSSRRLSRLVESLLDLGQLEAGKAVLHKAEASVGALITDAVEEVHPVAEAKGHMLHFHLDPDLPPLELDVEMIRRVLINLLENAIKYTPAGGNINISAERENGQLRVSVSDTGFGIPEADQQKVFDKFARIQREGHSRGLGLGLAFCRLAVEAHGGRIWVESEEGKGSTFAFTLPT